MFSMVIWGQLMVVFSEDTKVMSLRAETISRFIDKSDWLFLLLFEYLKVLDCWWERLENKWIFVTIFKYHFMKIN